MARGSDSRRPDQSSRRSSREPSSSGGGSRRQGDRSEAPSAPPPFASIAPSGHAMPQPGEEDEGTRAPTYRSTADRESRTAASTSRSSASNPPDYSTQAPRGARAARATSLSTLREESGTLASTRGGQTTRPAGGTRTDGPRGTTVAPRRGSRVDVNDHGVFSSGEEEPGPLAGPTRPTSGRTSGDRSGTAISRRPSDRTTGRTQTGRSETRGYTRGGDETRGYTRGGDETRGYTRGGDETRGYTRAGDQTRDYTRAGDRTVGRTRATERSAWGDDRTAIAGPSRQPQTRGGTSYSRTGRYDEGDDEEDYDDEEYEADEDDREAETVRAKSKWYDPRHPPRPQRAGYRDENLVYQIEGDDYEVFQYVMPSERADGGLAVLQQIDRRAQHLRDRHFSALELWTRAHESGFLRKIVAEDDDGYSYWTIENHNYDVAWACAQQGWWILGTGIGKDKGNFFMEQKDDR